MKTIKTMIADYKANNRASHEKEIRGQFKVVERGGVLYLTHNGTAFKIIGTDTCATDIATALEDARNAAVDYEGL